MYTCSEEFVSLNVGACQQKLNGAEFSSKYISPIIRTQHKQTENASTLSRKRLSLVYSATADYHGCCISTQQKQSLSIAQGDSCQK